MEYPSPNPTPAPDARDLESRDLDSRLARRLRELRQRRGWSLEALAAASGVSRATLSRLENAEVSATAAVLNRICGALGLPVSRLVAMAEDAGAAPLVRRAEQPVWTDPASGFVRRSVSPPAESLSGEAIEGRLPPGARLAYDRPPPGRGAARLEHHLVLLDGGLTVTLCEPGGPDLVGPEPGGPEPGGPDLGGPASGGPEPGGPASGEIARPRAAGDTPAPPAPGRSTRHRLAPGDCLRYRPAGATAFEADARTGARYLLFLV